MHVNYKFTAQFYLKLKLFKANFLLPGTLTLFFMLPFWPTLLLFHAVMSFILNLQSGKPDNLR